MKAWPVQPTCYQVDGGHAVKCRTVGPMGTPAGGRGLDHLGPGRATKDDKVPKREKKNSTRTHWSTNHLYLSG